MDVPLQHVALILDGNGRWANQRGLPRIDGHKAGARRVFKTVKHAFAHWGIPYITVYAFSTENWNRPKLEVNAIFRILKLHMKLQRKVFVENKIRFRTIGNIDKLPKGLKSAIDELSEATKHFSKHTLNIAINYGSREEIINAIKNWQNDHNKEDEITWPLLSNYLYTKEMPDPDLLIRTSGEMRLSNYLCLQSAYSELYFTKTCWPDFDEKEFDIAIEDYLKRNRKFGALK